MKATRVCSIEGCERPHRARGWCTTHWWRWRQYGTTEDRPPKKGRTFVRTPLAERLFARLVERENGCLEWTGPPGTGGYGQIKVGKKMVGAHRVAWELANGERIPTGMVVCHACDNPPCCNPEHLFVGTYSDNNLDMGQKWRHGNRRKTHCPQGHPYDDANTLWTSKGYRSCRTCRRERQRKAT